MAITTVLVFVIGAGGCAAAFAFWLQDFSGPEVAFLGSGDQLSLLVSDGPARLLLATGDRPAEFENALTQARTPFARRIDVLLVAGSGTTLLVPLRARGDPHVRTAAALAPLPKSAEAEAMGPIMEFTSPQRVILGPSIQVTVETVQPLGSDPEKEFPAWRAVIERGETRVVVLSDGSAAPLFPPDPGASVLAISGADPAMAWDHSPAVAFVANSAAIKGPEMRGAFGESRRPPAWGFRVFPGEALRLKFVPGGVELPAAPAQNLAGTPAAVGVIPNPAEIEQRVRIRRRASLSRVRTRP